MSVTINQALYGTGVYGTAKYGQLIVDINTGVLATGNIGTTTETGIANTTLTGVSATALTRALHINAFEVDITEPLYGPNALTGSIGTLEFANTVTLTGVVGTGQIGTVSPNIAFGITGVSATGATNTVTENVTEKPTGVVGTFTLNAAGLDIRSINRVPVTGSPMTGTIGTLTPNVDEPIATGVIGTTAVNSVQVNIAEKVSSVFATGSIGSLEHSNTVTLTGVEGVGQVGEVEDQPLERIATGVFATGAVGSLTLHTAAGLTGVVGTFSVGTPTVTGIIFNFVANDYDRKRVVYVPRQDTVAERRVAA